MPGIIYDLSRLPETTRKQIVQSKKYTAWFSKFPDKLFASGGDAKTVLGEPFAVKTFIMYGAPAMSSGVNMCPMAKIAKCEAPCLNTAGRGAMTNVEMARLRKTLFWQQYPEQFIAMFARDVERGCKQAQKLGMTPAFRPNGTTDIRWELYVWDVMVSAHKEYGARFYDYTKLANRVIPNPKVYDLTFSYSGVKAFQPQVKLAIDKGMRLAVVFDGKRSYPKRFLGKRTINGNATDIRFRDKQGVILALRAKGKAKQDKSGFVVSTY